MDLTRLTYLYRTYQRGQLTEAARGEWEAAVMDLSQDKNIQQLIDPVWQEEGQVNVGLDATESERIYRYIVSQAQRRKPRTKFYGWLPYAAAAIALWAIGFLFLPDNVDRPE